MINPRNTALLLGLGVLNMLVITPASAQSLSYTSTSNAPVTEDFDTLATSGTTNPYNQGATIAGFYFTNFGGTDILQTNYRAGNGGSSTGGTYSFGAGGSTDRAFGSLASNATGTIQFGVQIKNDTNKFITNFTVDYIGEQWRNGGNANSQKLTFHYSTDATSLTTGTYTAASALDFTSPIASTSVSNLDGNAAANRTTINSTVNLSTPLAAGSSLWLRWTDVNDANNDHGLAIDNFSFRATAVPAPSSVAVMALGGLMPVVAIARRRRTVK